MTGLAGLLLAKTAATHSRRKPKDWYDIAHVLLRNGAGGVDAAASAVLAKFGASSPRSAPLSTTCAATSPTAAAKAPVAYADDMVGYHPGFDDRHCWPML